MVTALENLVEALGRLPTIGRKSAWRLALHLMERPREELDNLAHCIAVLPREVKTCRECYNYSDAEVCSVCSSPRRDHGVICVVEKPTDVFTMEKSGRYNGVYHVLGGLLSPIDGVTADKLRIAELKQRVEQGEVAELILALGGGGEAETTAMYVASVTGPYGVRITRLARGVPAGMELEYIDQITLTQALQERTDVRYGER